VTCCRGEAACFGSAQEQQAQERAAQLRFSADTAAVAEADAAVKRLAHEAAALEHGALPPSVKLPPFARKVRGLHAERPLCFAIVCW
jgi:hypothetical protein